MHLHFGERKHRDHTHPYSPGPTIKPGSRVPGPAEGIGQEQAGASPPERGKGYRVLASCERRSLEGSEPPHQPTPAFLTSSGSNSEQAEHGNTGSGSPPAPSLPVPNDICPEALNGLGGKSYRGDVTSKGQVLPVP